MTSQDIFQLLSTIRNASSICIQFLSPFCIIDPRGIITNDEMSIRDEIEHFYYASIMRSPILYHAILRLFNDEFSEFSEFSNNRSLISLIVHLSS